MIYMGLTERNALPGACIIPGEAPRDRAPAPRHDRRHFTTQRRTFRARLSPCLMREFQSPETLPRIPDVLRFRPSPHPAASVSHPAPARGRGSPKPRRLGAGTAERPRERRHAEIAPAAAPAPPESQVRRGREKEHNGQDLRYDLRSFPLLLKRARAGN